MRKYGLILFLLLFLVFCPTLLSTKAGNRLLIPLLNTFLSGKVEVEKISLSWDGPLQVEGLRYESQTGTFLCSELTLTSWVKVLWKRPYTLGELSLQRPELTLFVSVTPSQPPLKEASSLPLPLRLPSSLPFTGKIEIKEGSVTLLKKGETPLLLSPLFATILLNEEEIVAEVQAPILQEGKKTGEILITSSIREPNASALLSLKQFPTALADRFCPPSYKGLGARILGDFIDLQCEATLVHENVKAKMQLTSPLTSLQVEIGSKEGMLALLKPATLQMKLPLCHPFSLQCTVKEWSCPYRDPLPSFDRSRGLIDLSLSCPLTEKASANFQTTIATENLQEALTAEMGLSFRTRSGEAKTLGNLTLQKPLSEDPSCSGSLKVSKTPLSLLSQLLCLKDTLSPWLGDEIEGELALSGPFSALQVETLWSSPLLTLNRTLLSLDRAKWTLNEPTQLTYKTPYSKDVMDVAILKASMDNTLTIEARALIPALLLPSFALEPFTAHLTIDSLESIGLSLEGSTLQMDSSWKLNPEELILSSPLHLSYKVPSHELSSLMKDRIHVEENLPFELTIDPTSFPLKAVEQANLKGRLSIPKALFRIESALIDLQQLIASFSFKGKEELLAFSFEAGLARSNTSFSFQGLFHIRELLFSSLDGTINALSLSLLDQALPLTCPLTPLLGPTLDMHLTLASKDGIENMQIQAKTPLLSLQGGLSLQDNSLFLPKGGSPLYIEYTMTKEGYESLWKGQTPFFLAQETTFKGKVEECLLRWEPNSFLPVLEKSTLKAHFSLQDLLFARQGTKDLFPLQNVELSLRKEKKNLHANFDASAGKEGKLHIETTVDSFNPSYAKADLKIGVKAFPSSFLDIALLSKEDLYKTVIGPTFDIESHLSLREATGPVSLLFTSPEVRASFEGELTSGILRLKTPATLEVGVTKKASRLFLQKSGSSIEALFTEQPIRVWVGAEGASFPVLGFSLSRLILPDVRITLGKVKCQSKGNLDFALNLLKAKERKETELWFAPIDLHVHRGMVEVERTEVLLGGLYDLAIWGGVNLPESYVSLTLGLTAQALSEALGVKNLPSDYVLKIPLKGPFNDIQVDKAAATSKIAALMLWKNKMVQKGLGPLGGLLDVIPPPGGEGKTPPARPPFPWQE